MKMAPLITLVFWLGFHAGRWDAKHGAEAGYKLGRWTRVHVLGLE